MHLVKGRLPESVHAYMAWCNLHQWVAAEATLLEWQAMLAREREFTPAVEDTYPRSAGLLHRVTKWRAAWQPPHQQHNTEACGGASMATCG